MGFLQPDTSNIFMDAIVTDLGRQKLAQGTFNIVKFALGDDEVDYGMITRYGRTVGSERIEKNTPVFEAVMNNKLALVHPLVSIPDPNLDLDPDLDKDPDPDVDPYPYPYSFLYLSFVTSNSFQT
jgi:hypothetical protein